MPQGVAYKFGDVPASEDVKFDGAVKFDSEVKQPEPQAEPTNVDPAPEQAPPVQPSEPAPEPPVQEPQPTAPPAPKEEPIKEPLPTAIDDKALLEYLNKNEGTSYTSMDEYKQSLVKEKVVEKVIEKEPELDPEMKAFQKFKKETGQGFQEWLRLNQDYDKMSDTQLALAKIKSENIGLGLTDGQAKILLAEQLGVPVEDFDEMGEVAGLKMKVLANNFKQKMLGEKNKYYTSDPQAPQPTQPGSPDGDKVMVNGQPMDRETYNRQRQQYLSTNEEAVKAIDRDTFKIEVEGKGGKSTIEVGYAYTDDDKQFMLSATESVDQIVSKFVGKDGKVDHTGLNKAVRWMDSEFREKAIGAMMQQARSAGVNEVIKKANNVDFDPSGKPHKEKKKDEKYGELPTGSSMHQGVKVKYPFNS